MNKTALIAGGVVGLSLLVALAMVVVAGAFTLGRSTGAQAPATIAPVAVAPPVLPPPPPAPILTPLQMAVLEAGAEAQRLATLDPASRDAALGAWAEMGALSYGTLMRNPDERVGLHVAWRGRVEEIHDNAEGGSQLRVALRGYGNDVLWVETIAARAPDGIEQGSRVRVYGVVAGSWSYRSQAGWEITLPAIAAVAIVSDSRR